MRVEPEDGAAVERLARYIMRPPVTCPPETDPKSERGNSVFRDAISDNLSKYEKTHGQAKRYR